MEIPGPGPELNIKVTDPIGKKNWKGRSSAPKQYIDLSEKPSGIYFVNVLSGTTKIVAKIVLE